MSVVGVLKENYLDTHLSHYLRLSGANESNFKDLIRDELIKLYDEIGPEYKPCTIIHPGTSAPFEDLTVGDYNSIMAKLNSKILFFINKRRYDMLIKDGFADPTEKMFFSSTGVVSNMKLRTYLRFDPNIIKKLYLNEEEFVTHVNTLEKCGLHFQKDYYKRGVFTLLDSPGRFTSRGIKTIVI